MTQGNVNLKLGLDTSPATAALQQYYKKLNQSTTQAASSQKKVTTELEKVVASAKKLGLTYDKVTKSFKNSKGVVQTLSQVKQRVDQLNASLAKTKKTADTALAGIGAGFKQVLQGIPQGIGLAIGQQLLAPLNNFGAALNGAIGGAVQRFVDIDEALRQTASISGATTAEFEQLQDAVINLAKDTKFTTGELAEASIALARAGFTAAEVQEALPGIAEGAAAAGQSMDQMSDTVIGAMGGFQKSTDETIDVVDVLTQTANMSNQSVTDLGEALKYVGPIANGLGLTMEDTAAAVGLLANAGIRGSQAGTTLRSGLSRLAAAAAGNNSEFSDLSRGTGRLAETLKRLGADITDTNGDLKAMPELLKTLKASLGDLGANEQQLVSKILFGEEAAAGFRALLANTVEDIDGFAEATNNATGVAKDTSEKNLAGIGGSLVLLSSAFDAASATVGKFLGTILKPLVDGVTALLNAFNSLPGPVQAVVVGFTGLTIAVTAASVAFAIFTAAANAGVFATIGNSVATAVASFGVLATAIKTKAVAAFATAKTASLAFSATMKQQITVTGALTAAKAKLTAAQIALNASTGIGATVTGTATTAATGYAAAQATVGAAGQTSAAGSAAAAGGMKAFIAAAGPIALVAVALGVVASAWDSYAQIAKGAKEANDALGAGNKELIAQLKDLGAVVDETNKEKWEASVESVGNVRAGYDRMARALSNVIPGINIATGEQAKFNQTSNELAEGLDRTVKNLQAGKQAYDEQVARLSELSVGSREYKNLAREVEETEKVLIATVTKKIAALKDLKKELAARNAETDAEKQAQATSIAITERSIEVLTKQKTALEGAAAGFDKVKKAAKGAGASVDDAKKAFEGNIKAMESSFKDFQDGFKDGLKDEVDGIKGDLADFKEEAKVFTDIKREEIDSIKEVEAANTKSMTARIDSAKESGEADIASIQAAGAEADRAHEARVGNIEDLSSKEQAAFDARIDRANEETEAAVAGIQAQQDAADDALDAAVSGMEQQIEASNDRYDALIDGARKNTEATVKGIEAQGEAADKVFDKRIEKLESLNEQEGAMFDRKIERIAQETEAVVAGLQKQQDAADRELEADLRALDRKRDSSNSYFDGRISAADSAHSRVMANYDRELQALDAQRDAVNDAFDARLDGLRALTPAEAQLKALRIAELEAEAKLGGMDGLRAQATLERMRADEEAARIRKEQAAVLAALEEQKEAKQVVARAAEMAHEATVAKLNSDRIEKEESFVTRMEALKEKAAEAALERSQAAQEAEEASALRIEQIQAQRAERETERLGQIEILKEQQALQAEARAKRIQAVQEAGEKKLETLANAREANEQRIQNSIEATKKQHGLDAKVRENEMKTLKAQNIADVDKLEADAASAQSTRLNDIQIEKDKHVVDQKAREDEILDKQKANADEVKLLEGELETMKENSKIAQKVREDEIKAKKKEVVDADKQALIDIKELEEAEQIRKNTAEDDFAAKKAQLLEDYETALGETNTKIIDDGKTAWTTYADNALEQIGRVAEAAAAAATASAPSAGTTTTGAPLARWSGGPVSAGQRYTVNELGQEAFRSSTGKISMIDAPAFGAWKAPSKGTVINAAQTEKLGLMASTESPVSNGAAIDPAGGRASQHVSGNESRNLLRAIAKAMGGDNITNNVTIQSANTTQAASDMMVELTKIKRRRLR